MMFSLFSLGGRESRAGCVPRGASTLAGLYGRWHAATIGDVNQLRPVAGQIRVASAF